MWTDDKGIKKKGAVRNLVIVDMEENAEPSFEQNIWENGKLLNLKEFKRILYGKRGNPGFSSDKEIKCA